MASKRLHFAIAVMLTFLLLPALYPSQASTDYHEYARVVNLSENSGRSSEPRIAMPYYDNPYIVWTDFSFGESEVLFKASRDGGKSFGKTINLSNSSGPSDDPQIAAWAERIYVIWNDRTLGNNEVIFASSADHGETFAPAMSLSDSSKNSVEAKVALLESTENVYIVWIEQDESTGLDDVLLRVSMDNGLTFGEAINLSNNNNNGRSSSNPQLDVSYADEHLYVTWQTVFEDGNTEVFFRHSGDGGLTFDKTVNLSNTDAQSAGQKMAVSDAYVYVVWHEHNSTLNDIFFKRINTGSSNFGRAINLSSYPVENDSDVSSPQIATTYSQSVFVLWHETPSSGNNRIVLRLSLDAGDHFVDRVILDESAGSLESSHIAAGDSLSIVWHRDNDTFFRQQSLADWSVFTGKINLSNNTGDSYSPQIAAVGPKVAAIWIDESFGDKSEIAFMDVTSLVYFEYPLYSYFTATTDDHLPVMNILAGDNVTVTALIDNYKERIRADAMFGLQVLDEHGFVEFVSVSNATILPEEQHDAVTFTWVPEQSGWKVIEGFLWSNDGYALAEKIEDQRVAVAFRQDYKISLEHHIEKSSVASGEPVNGSLYLVNEGDQTEFVKVDEIYGSNPPLNSCYSFQSSELDNPLVLPAGARVNLNSTITWMQSHPATYNSTWSALLSIKSGDGNVNCLQVASNTVPLDVIAPPNPEGVSLVLSTDKQEYRRNETIHLEAFVDNNTDNPFDLNNFEFGVYFTDRTGKEIAALTWVSSDGDDEVKPHSKQSVPLDELGWDQSYPEPDGRWVQAPVGEYTVHAEYWQPFIKSDPLAIEITE